MPRTEIVETIFKEGKDAHDRGVLRCQGRYPPGSRRGAEWLMGWDAALKAGYGQRDKLKEMPDTVAVDEIALGSDEGDDASILGDLPKLR